MPILKYSAAVVSKGIDTHHLARGKKRQKNFFFFFRVKEFKRKCSRRRERESEAIERKKKGLGESLLPRQGVDVRC